jgi:hypothetical protein
MTVITDIAGAFSLLLGGPGPAATAAWTIGLLAVAAAIAAALRRPSLEGIAFGLLILTAAADLALLALRGAGGATSLHLPLTAVLAVPLVVALRRWVLPPPAATPPPSKGEVALMVAVAAAFWALRIIQVQPSSGLSSQLGWLPQYLHASFEAGRFLLPGDLRLGIGPAESLFYGVDMLGVAALAGDSGYPPYLATSIASIGVAVLLPIAALRGRPAAQMTYVVMLAALLVADVQVQAAIARHWGDNILILGGTLIMTALARRPASSGSLLTACAAAAFLVLARHYGALFAALVMAGAALATWRREGRRVWRHWPAALALAVLLGVLSVRDITYILHPVPYYPGDKLVVLAQHGWQHHVDGALHDWGLMTEGRWLLFHPRAAWLWGLALLLAAGHWRRLPIVLAPLVVMLLPEILHVVTGYRTSYQTNKPYLLAVLFGAFYPAFAIGLLTLRRRQAGERWLRRAMATLAAAAAAWVIAGPLGGFGPGKTLAWARGLYDARIVDLGIANALAEAGIPAAAVAGRPLMYFYCEPGMGLRNYLGGSLKDDLDFWGATVQEAMPAAANLGELVAGLGWPNLYISAEIYYDGFVDDRWRRFEADLAAIERQPWVDRVIRHGKARLVLVKE